MKVIKSYLTNNACYKANRTITVRGLMLHSVGCNQPSAEVFAKKWNDPNMTRQICCHGMIDGNTGDVRQFLPWNHRGWHGASGKNGSCNNSHIGVEMCEPACIKYTGGSSFTCSDKPTARAVAQRTYDSAVQLFAMLCKEFNLDPLADGVIISHKEGHRRGISSNHGDPEHLWTQLDMGLTMDTFRRAVKAAMSGATDIPVREDDVPAKDNDVPATGTAQEVPFIVRVNIDNLNIRKGPGTNYDKVGRYTGKGAFTIVEVRPGEGSTAGWGKLKSGAGWISLDYAKRI